MKTNEVEGAQMGVSTGRMAVHGAHRKTLEALFRHPTSHNLEWIDVLGLIGNIGVVHEKANGQFVFEIGGARLPMHKPHTKDLPVTEVVELRHFLQRTGWSPDGATPAPARPEPAAPILMVVVDHHGAKIYRIDTASGDDSKLEIRPYDPHHFLHHLTHKEQLREQGQRAPEDPSFYQRISDALAAGGRIVVVGHGTGKSNAAGHLMDYLRTHHPETYQRVVREIEADLSAITTAQLLKLAEQALGRAS